MEKTAIFYAAHFVSAMILRELRKLRSELGPEYDIFVVGLCNDPGSLAGISIEGVCTLPITEDKLRFLPYKNKIPDSAWPNAVGKFDLALMLAAITVGGDAFTHYRHYWVIEFDVRFLGAWNDFMDVFYASSIDLLATHVTDYPTAPDWMHWSSLDGGDDLIDQSQYLRAFLPIMRVSPSLLQEIDKYYRNGWTGHIECLWPTIARIEGLKVEDIGGGGEFVPKERVGKYYFAGMIGVEGREMFISTFGAWPAYLDGSIAAHSSYFDNMLWHPVK